MGGRAAYNLLLLVLMLPFPCCRTIFGRSGVRGRRDLPPHGHVLIYVTWKCLTIDNKGFFLVSVGGVFGSAVRVRLYLPATPTLLRGAIVVGPFPAPPKNYKNVSGRHGLDKSLAIGKLLRTNSINVG